MEYAVVSYHLLCLIMIKFMQPTHAADCNKYPENGATQRP